jgi:CubicO group peptidase (beta-lactamase class C family)
MTAKDNHLWMSNAKTIPSLILDMLVSEGKLDQNQTVGHYMPDFRGTAWENIKIIDIWDMTPGLNSEENDKTRADSNSITIRVFLAEFGLPFNGKHEKLVDVLKEAQYQNEPGVKFEYGSPDTEVLVLLAEAITNEPFAQLVDKHVWSKMYAEAPLQLHLSPNGVAVAHGLVSSTLRDMARFGMLYTPSWSIVATEKVVSDEIIDRIRNGVRGRDFYRNGFDGPAFVSRLDDDNMISNSRQWDAVWPDGDFWKSGIGTQGIYVSPDRDLVMVFYTTNVQDDSAHRYLRRIATSGLFD